MQSRTSFLDIYHSIKIIEAKCFILKKKEIDMLVLYLSAKISSRTC